MSDSVVSSGMTVSGLTVDGGSSLTVLSGGLAVDTTVSSGSADIVAGVTSDTLLQAFATETVLSGGQALHTSVGSAAAQFISGGGVASATAIGSGGEVYVLSYGLAQAAVVEAGGLLVVSSGGTAVATDIASGGAVQLQDFAVASGGRIERGGAEVVLSDGETIDDRIEAGGFLVVSSGGAATSADVASGGFLVISAGGIADDAVVHSGGMEVISAGGSAVDTLLEAGGGIDLDAIGFAADGTATLDRDTDILTIDENGTETELQLAGDYDGIYFRLSADGDGSTIVTADGTPCYCPGTLIETERGEVPVERLRIGDRLRTASGALRPLRWIGRRSYDGRFAAGRADILPVVVRAGALGGGLPRRDLFVSPLHALFLDGMLVPAAALLNGNSIVQAAAVDTVEYIHLEFDEHDVILAEGAPAESFVDDDSRGMFHNAHEFAALYPDAPPVSARYCAPRLEAGERLEALRRRLAEHAMPYPARPEIPIDGRLDAADHHTVRGWVRGVPGGGPVRLRILDNNRTVAVVDAVPAGPDPLDAGAARGGTPPDRDRLGFAFVVPGGLDPTRRHVLQVQTLPGQRELPGSPVFLDPVAAVGTPEAVPALPAPVASADAEPDCRGHLDRVRRGLVTGWAWNAATPGEAVAVQLFSGGRLLCRVVANAFRPDLLAAGIGDGRHGFSVDLGAELSPLDRHVVHARIERTGRELAGSPAVVEPADRFDGALEGVVSGAVDALRDPDRERAVLDFLRTQCDRLGQRIADNSARRDERERVREARRALGPAAARMAPPPPRALVIDERMPSPDR
ncbi:MAG: Hint domain-containing protein, partial [Gluconacetobacter diazotrophicus]|nr:Hint domain-containing protein [Gluconacetobacter diazotrophicus]